VSEDLGPSPQTWHHGVVAKWWAAFNTEGGPELAFYQQFVEAGQPAEKRRRASEPSQEPNTQVVPSAGIEPATTGLGNGVVLCLYFR
jgi:hypothetical protein